MKIVSPACLLLLASAASAGPLLRPKGPAGVVEQPLTLDAARLTDLRGRHSAVLESVPLGRDGTATLALHRVDPFTKDLRIEADTPTGLKTLPPPDAVYFGGTVVGEPRSLVLLVAGPDAVRGKMVETIIWSGTFGGRFEDRSHAIEVFERHNREVVERVPAERLLRYEVKEGWEPLCRFLGVEVPKDQPFPHLNDTQSFLQMVSARE